MNRLSFNKLSKSKILAINGSHRKGNTQSMLSTIVNSINQKNPQYEAILLNLRELNINYSTTGDYLNHDPTNCTCCHDDIKLIFPLMQSANLIIFGSPIYFYSVTGRMKTFIDRCNIFMWNKKLKDKKVFTICVGGSTQADEMLNSLNEFYKALGMVNVGSYFVRAQSAQDIARDHQERQKLKQLSLELIKHSL